MGVSRNTTLFCATTNAPHDANHVLCEDSPASCFGILHGIFKFQPNDTICTAYGSSPYAATAGFSFPQQPHAYDWTDFAEGTYLHDDTPHDILVPTHLCVNTVAAAIHNNIRAVPSQLSQSSGVLSESLQGASQVPWMEYSSQVTYDAL